MTTLLRRPLLAALAMACLLPAAGADFPPVPPVADQANLGVGIQRTMTLLATSTPEKRNHVRILFYGQSITEQAWTKLVSEDLKKRFPNADLDIQNRAIGGFASQLLRWPAEHDLYPFYPDLVIFHVYGANNTYEEIIHNIRTRTTAEVLMQKDHVGAKLPPVVKDWDAAKELEKTDKGMWWDYMMNYVFLPDIAKKHGCGVADVRTPWVKYLADNKLDTRALLKDDIHLNDHGCFVMASIVSQYLIHRPDLSADAWKDLVKESKVGADVKAAGGKLKLEFDGNRVDLVLDPKTAKLNATVLIDGKKPSEFPGCYHIPRPAPWPWSALFLKRVDHPKPLILEDWTLTLTKVAADSKSWSFTVKGSVTGDDGAGESGTTFTSPSGRVQIDKDAWFPGGAKIDVGYKITWSVKPLFVDTISSATTSPITVAQGFPVGKHTLEITLDNPAAITAIRTFNPPMK